MPPKVTEKGQRTMAYLLAILFIAIAILCSRMLGDNPTLIEEYAYNALKGVCILAAMFVIITAIATGNL